MFCGRRMQRRTEKWKNILCKRITEEFHLLKRESIPEEAMQNISVDIDRSVFRERTFLGVSLETEARPYDVQERKKELKDVLVAFAKYNTNIEYCQGLSYYAAFLLQFYGAEESFFMLCETIQTNQIEKLFDKQLSLISKVLSVHGRVLNITLPECIRKVLVEISGEVHDYAAGWYLTLFSRLSPTIYADILDLFYLHGFPVLFHVASALVEVGHYTYILDKPLEQDQRTQILFKLAEYPIPEAEFKETLQKNMQMLDVHLVRHMLYGTPNEEATARVHVPMDVPHAAPSKNQ
ncbi:hypothetical protein NEFER03_0767 [Nematocida sp. LUAm3]|nr:hypothetical protein NEFER03_0767 [Nematocida sp. LUAm3]KAI5175226.1 hypothetical protein NEFER02_1187 [Nematocida sp. LUAm2]KAI5178102.1 hypothetical protein NEFER01_1280 [Nematocida sp. LUAm1]